MPIELSDPIDVELVQNARAGDRAAFTAIVRHYDPRLRALASRLLAGDAHAMDDALQDAYVRAYRSIDTFRNDAAAGSWLYRIVFNSCIDELRRRRRRPEPVDVSGPTWDRPSTDRGPDATAATGDLTRRALAALSDEQRVVLVLVDGEGYDHATVARVLGIAPGTVASRASRARAQVRRTFADVRGEG